jgi:hypothetical protein
MDRTLLTRKRIQHELHYYVILPDNAAGSGGRYTVYRMPSSPSRKITIIGRELPLGHAQRIVREHVELEGSK